jgi:hypothetical protein
MEDYVISYDLAVKLKDLGIEFKKSMFVYENKILKNKSKLDYEKNILPAFMTDEILQMLPNRLGNYYLTTVRTINNEYVVCYELNQHVKGNIFDTKPCNALAKMLIWLIENRYVKVSELNV